MKPPDASLVVIREGDIDIGQKQSQCLLRPHTYIGFQGSKTWDLEQVGLPRHAGPSFHQVHTFLVVGYDDKEALHTLVVELFDKLVCLELEGWLAIGDDQKSRLCTLA